MQPPGPVRHDVRLSDHTTLAVGGPARWFATCGSVEGLTAWLAAARETGVPTLLLGGGSNVLVADEGFDGLVLALEDDTIEVHREGDRVRVRAGAGLEWDRLVARCVAEGWSGIECLSGIPGRVGAAPIQNIGAYGQEVCESIAAVEVVDRSTGEQQRIEGPRCGFGYRWSHFKGTWRDRYVVAKLELLLTPGGAPALRYPELQREVGWREGMAAPPVEVVREAVVTIRRRKSMVYDREDPNHRSAGSFFMNPVIPADRLAQVQQALQNAGHPPDSVAAYPAGEGQVKLAAAALIERAGFPRGMVHGRAGLSTRHTLALINRGDARAADLIALAAHIRAGVRNAFGVQLYPEPVFVGFDRDVDALLG